MPPGELLNVDFLKFCYHLSHYREVSYQYIILGIEIPSDLIGHQFGVVINVELFCPQQVGLAQTNYECLLLGLIV